MICSACGAANEDGAMFCDKCKADLEMPAAHQPNQAANPMNESATLSESTFSNPGDEPIALEPIPLEPVHEITPPSTFEPAGSAPDSVSLESTADQPAIGAEGQTLPTPKPKTAAVPPPVPAAPTFVSPKLLVVRGQRMDVQYPLFAGKNYLGRTDDKPVDIDLDDQEAPDRIWTSRQHAVITLENGTLAIEDLSSLNGTFVNRTRVHPGQSRELHENDVIQVGTVHMKVLAG